jgi:hypothetical protein
MLTAARIPKKKFVPSYYLQPVLPIIPEKTTTLEEDKSKFISIDLKTRVGAAASSSTYKKYIKKFEEGSPQEWIDTLQDLEEVWRQNFISRVLDKVSTVRAVLKGESLIAFEAAIQETDNENQDQELNDEKIKLALDAVTRTVFPHRALEIQKLWMQRGMRKPPELGIRKTVASITRINNSLPLFPDGREDSKFSEQELVGLIEWALPASWRAKFDLEGYVPTEGTKKKLVEACEAIERSAGMSGRKDEEEKNKKNEKKNKFYLTFRNKNKKYTIFFCTECGRNPTHSTSECFILKNKAKNSENAKFGKPNRPKSFSNQNFRKEVNYLAKSSSKKKVLDLYASAIAREQKKLKRLSLKRLEKKTLNEVSESASSDSETMSVELLEPPYKKIKGSVNKNVTDKKIIKKRSASVIPKKTDTSKRSASSTPTKKCVSKGETPNLETCEISEKKESSDFKVKTQNSEIEKFKKIGKARKVMNKDLEKEILEEEAFLKQIHLLEEEEKNKVE